MLNIEKEKNGNEGHYRLEGRLDMNQAMTLENELKEDLETADKLIFDLKDLIYISSAGLRIMLFAHKSMMQKGGMVLRNVTPEVQQIFDITCFSDLLNIE